MPPNTTILVQGAAAAEWLVGVDLQFFSVRVFCGVKDVPPGLHFFHYSAQGDALGVRHGMWLECHDHDVVVLTCDAGGCLARVWPEAGPDTDGVVPLDYSQATSKLPAVYGHMVEYPAAAAAVARQLCGHIDPESLRSILGNGLQISTIDSLEANYTAIDMRARRPHATLEQITRNHLDKSWLLEELFGPDHGRFFVELEVAFVHFVVLGNYCSMAQWINLVTLASRSESFLAARKSFSLSFLTVLHTQLSHLPADYLSGEQCQLDVEAYTDAMQSLGEVFEGNDEQCCGRMKLQGMVQNQWAAIVALQRERFGLDFDAIRGFEDDGPVVVDRA
ncbi:A1 cistron-splicing factor AAR2 [[Candida] zeylanoides]